MCHCVADNKYFNSIFQTRLMFVSTSQNIRILAVWVMQDNLSAFIYFFIMEKKDNSDIYCFAGFKTAYHESWPYMTQPNIFSFWIKNWFQVVFLQRSAGFCW